MQKLLDRISDTLGKFLPAGIMRVINGFLTVSFITFLVIGVINTFSTTVISTVFDKLTAMLSGGAQEVIIRFNLTFIAGYIVSLVISFFLNTHFTFHEKPTWKKFIKFPLSYVPNFIIQYVTVRIFSAAGLNLTLAYMIAAVIGIPITFLVMKLLVFNKRK